MKIGYLFHHNALLNGEVELLKEEGHQVYLPLIITFENNFYPSKEEIMSIRNIGNHDWVSALDRYDVYKEDCQEFLDLLSNFDLLIISLYNTHIVKSCKNKDLRIFIRIFGREGTLTYKSISDHFNIFHIVMSNPNINYLQAYEEIALNEPPEHRHKYVFLPLPIPRNMKKMENNWIGQIKKIFFVCSRCDNPYYRGILANFKKTFADRPHNIFGKQESNIKDPFIISNLPDDKYYEAMKNYRVMFYHGVEPRHLHYHPLEAIVIGMPVIYMKRGLLYNFAVKNTIAACDSYEDAKRKVDLILSGDQQFTRRVIIENKVILRHFSDMNWKMHKNNLFMNGRTMSKNPNPNPKIVPGGLAPAAQNVPPKIALGGLAQHVPLKMINACIGIGDILIYTYCILHNNDVDKVMLVFSREMLNKFRNNSKSHADLISYLLNVAKIKCIWTATGGSEKCLSTSDMISEYKITRVDKYLLPNTFKLSVSHALPKEYIVFHTKCRQGYTPKLCYDTIAKFFETFKTSIPIVLLGERKISNLFENNVLKVVSLYDILIGKLRINNTVHDYTADDLQLTPNADSFMRDLTLIHNAKCNVIFGQGGNLVMTCFFSKKFIAHVDMQHPLFEICSHGVFCRNWNSMANELSNI